jgi:CDK-activating kinase assembly factor MAT1
LNEIDVDATEKAIATYTRSNTSLIAANKERAVLEQLSQSERDELDKRTREERMRMIEDAAQFERVEEERIKVEIIDALGKGLVSKADDVRSRHEIAKSHRAGALAKVLPAGKGELDEGAREENTTDPLKEDYTGAYVPIPYNPPVGGYRDWFTPKADYIDGRSWVVWVNEDREGKVRGGGWDLKGFWRGEIEAGVMSLGEEPLVGV